MTNEPRKKEYEENPRGSLSAEEFQTCQVSDMVGMANGQIVSFWGLNFEC